MKFLPRTLSSVPLFLGGNVVVDAVDHLLQLLVLLEVSQCHHVSFCSYKYKYKYKYKHKYK